MVNFVVAIPTYNRVEEVTNKTLKTLKDGGVSKNKIYLFVAYKLMISPVKFLTADDFTFTFCRPTSLS